MKNSETGGGCSNGANCIGVEEERAEQSRKGRKQSEQEREREREMVGE